MSINRLIKTSSFIGSTLGAVVITAALGAVFAALSITVLGTYGWALFAGLPLCLGFVAACLREPGSMWRAFDAGIASTLLTGVVIVAAALDGAICVLMALPLAMPMTMAGAYAGWLVRRVTSRPPRTFAIALVALPLAMGAEAKVDRPPPLHSVTTSVIVNAPPEAVWRRVVAFPPLPEPRSMHFRAGIAYPRSATISGQGVGAVRRCRFSTGDFVEPITVWDEPRRLAFSVTEQPVADARAVVLGGRAPAAPRRLPAVAPGRVPAHPAPRRPDPPARHDVVREPDVARRLLAALVRRDHRLDPRARARSRRPVGGGGPSA